MQKLLLTKLKLSKKSLMILGSLLSFLILSACATKVPDVPICKDFGDEGYCIHTVSNVEFLVDNSSNPWPYKDSKGRRLKWSSVKSQSVIVPIDSYKDLAVYMLSQCKRNNNCAEKAEPTMKAKVSRFNRNANFVEDGVDLQMIEDELDKP